MGSGKLPSACYILSDESSIPFYSTSNGYKNVTHAYVHILWRYFNYIVNNIAMMYKFDLFF